MDLGLDPASKQARKMIDRVDKRLVFKPLNNRPFLHGETEPCINGRILALGAYFKEPNDALARQLLREQLEDGGWNCEAVEPSAKRPRICLSEWITGYSPAANLRPNPLNLRTLCVRDCNRLAETPRLGGPGRPGGVKPAGGTPDTPAPYIKGGARAGTRLKLSY